MLKEVVYCTLFAYDNHVLYGWRERRKPLTAGSVIEGVMPKLDEVSVSLMRGETTLNDQTDKLPRSASTQLLHVRLSLTAARILVAGVVSSLVCLERNACYVPIGKEKHSLWDEACWLSTRPLSIIASTFSTLCVLQLKQSYSAATGCQPTQSIRLLVALLPLARNEQIIDRICYSENAKGGKRALRSSSNKRARLPGTVRRASL